MNDIKIVNAKIGKTYLGNGDGYMSYIIHVEWDSAGTGFGTHDLRYYGIELIDRLLKVVGVECWEDLAGKHIRLKKRRRDTIDIGNIIKDDWLDLDGMRDKIEAGLREAPSLKKVAK